MPHPDVSSTVLGDSFLRAAFINPTLASTTGGGVAAAASSTVHVWDLETRATRRISAGRSSVFACRVSGDAALFSLHNPSALRLVDLATGAVRLDLEVRPAPRALALDPGGRFIAWAGGDDRQPGGSGPGKLVHLRWLDSGDQVALKVSRGEVSTLDISRDGRRIAGGGGKQVRVWSRTGEGLNTDKPVTLKHDDAVRIVRFSQDGRRLFTAAGSTVSAFDPETGAALWQRTVSATRGGLCPSAHGLAVTANQSLLLLDPDTGAPETIHEGASREHLGDVLVHDDMAYLAQRLSHRLVRVRLPSGERLPDPPGLDGAPEAVAISTDGSLALLCAACKAELWDLGSRQRHALFTSPEFPRGGQCPSRGDPGGWCRGGGLRQRPAVLGRRGSPAPPLAGDRLADRNPPAGRLRRRALRRERQPPVADAAGVAGLPGRRHR